jgi:hypothetical protein
MIGNKRGAIRAPGEDVQLNDFSIARGGFDSDMADDKSPRIVKTFDEFMDRVPAWPFHMLGAVAALAGLWFAMAAMGGLPRGVVEWIALAMFGAFAYSVGFIMLLLLAFLLEATRRFSVAAILVGGVTLLGAMALQGPV